MEGGRISDLHLIFDKCVILGASSVIHPQIVASGDVMNDGDDNGSIPESFNTNGGLKLHVVWTISSLIAASARHYLLGCCINNEQLELRVKPLSTSKRTLVPQLNMKLWYAAYLELPYGSV
ncbi:hypothetical protein HanRHA438_Chr00c34g0855681 [Helianthus annuus]|nr:putative F-box protein AUF1 [Helianthus annuus]KAJ0597112.1 putative F-box protein AUF1 [Helianthus annuus]KAJ0757789.1 putative F-box protein AUF1 [Helianthus annuus]KAJ0761464.1 putative F-box protein AUF1 [Helianthus annuus]KAJ0926981.1 hypothetical protein HanRHA438_Chr04g0177541 [Helianthus annuus]